MEEGSLLTKLPNTVCVFLVADPGCSSPQVTNEPSVCFPEDEFFSGDNGVDLLIEDQLLRHTDLLPRATRRPVATSHGAAVTRDESTPPPALSSARPQALTSAPSVPDPTLSASAEQFSTPVQTTSVSPDPTGEAVLKPSAEPATTMAHTATQQPPASASPSVAPGDAFMEATHMAQVPPTTVQTDSLGRGATAGQGAAPTSPSRPTLSPEEEDDIRNVIGEFILPGLCLPVSSGERLVLERG